MKNFIDASTQTEECHSAAAASISLSMDQAELKLHLSRSEYVRKAIELMNNMLSKKERSSALASASMRVRNESMAINAEFAEIEYDLED